MPACHFFGKRMWVFLLAFHTSPATAEVGDQMPVTGHGLDGGASRHSGISREEAVALQAAVVHSQEALDSSTSMPAPVSLLSLRKGQRVHLTDRVEATQATTELRGVSSLQDPIHVGAPLRERRPDEFLENGPSKAGNDRWSGIVLGFVMIGDTRGQWNEEEVLRDTTEDGGSSRWMKELFSINRAKAKRHGYRMAVRRSTTLGSDGLTAYQMAGCQEHGQEEEYCREFYQRLNHNWEKEAMIVDYLNQTGVNYILVMDGDAVMVHPRANTIQKMADELKRTGRDIFIADEDWSVNGKGKVNGGLVFAKNTNFTRQFFGDIVNSHVLGDKYKGPGPRCKNNEQLCLSAAISAYPDLKNKILVASGRRWNRHPCLWTGKCSNGGVPPDAKVFDPNLQVVHFMGGAKGAIHGTLHNMGIIK